MHDPDTTQPTPDERVDERLTQLEIKASYSEDLLDELNAIVARQQAQIDQLIRELQFMKQQNAAAEPNSFRSLRDELPPHY